MKTPGATSRRCWTLATVALVVAGLFVNTAVSHAAQPNRQQWIASAPPSPAPTPVVSGNHLIDTRSGLEFIPRGVNWPSFEYACAQGWGYSYDSATAATASAIASWNANTVRLPLDQDCWQGTNGVPASGGGVTRSSTGYQAAVVAFVRKLNAAGLVVVLDLHSFATHDTDNVVGQLAMPNPQSVAFWSTVATKFKAYPSVMFDAYNEPYSRLPAFSLTWDCWRNGGCPTPVEDDYSPTLSGRTYSATGMNEIIRAIRTGGGAQPIMVGGLDYANDLREWPAHKPDDPQLVASFHTYQFNRCSTLACWNDEIAPVAAVVPVVTGEFGETDGNANFLNTYMNWADAHHIGYLAWAWWVINDQTDNGKLALISNVDGTPKGPLGTALRAHLTGQPQNGSPGTFTALAPARLVDTRSGSGPLGPGATLTAQITGEGGVPTTGASAVAMNMTVTGPTSNGDVTAYSSTSGRPGTSNLNYAKGQTIAGLVMVPIGADGKVKVYNGSNGRAQILLDVAGYYHSGVPALPGTFESLSPVRILDTRQGTGGIVGPVDPAGSIAVRAGVPAGVGAAIVNVTVTRPTRFGYLTVFGGSRPGTSNINFAAGQTIPNLAVAPIRSDGKTQLYNGSAGTSQLIADLAGYYLPGTPTVSGSFSAIGPTRVLDTRGNLGARAPIGAGATIAVQIAGVRGIPATGVSSVVVNLTAVAPAENGHLTPYPSGIPRSSTSALNFVAGSTIANLAVVPVGTDGKIRLYNGSAGSTAVLADVQGYFLSAATPQSGPAPASHPAPEFRRSGS